MTGHRDELTTKIERHSFDKAGFATTGWSLENDRQALAKCCLEDQLFVAIGNIVWSLGARILAVAKHHGWIIGIAMGRFFAHICTSHSLVLFRFKGIVLELFLRNASF